MRSPTPLLDYHRPTRTPWKRFIIAAIAAATLACAVVYTYRAVVVPRRQRAAVVRSYVSRLEPLLAYQHPPNEPVAIILDDALLKRDPQAFDRFGVPRSYREHTSHPIPEVTLRHRHHPEGWNGSQEVHLWATPLSNVFLHRRTASDGHAYLVGLDVNVLSRVLTFYASTFDLAPPDPAVRLYERKATIRTVKVAQWHFDGESCYVMPGQPDEHHPSAFSFVIHHGQSSDVVRGTLQPDGSVKLTPTQDQSGHWNLNPRP
jgi:hypothetical protein